VKQGSVYAITMVESVSGIDFQTADTDRNQETKNAFATLLAAGGKIQKMNV